ncbi:MAG: glycoside hydrolase family 3 C-terminal domain-containing protein, partial [Pseudonocardiaceae bacterium]
DRLGIPSVLLADGPHGLRKQQVGGDHVGISDSFPATCFPPAVALGSTWDADLLSEVGAALGRECRAEGVAVLLGPGINIKRSPLCGRNFEYFSEDPHISGQLGAAFVTGVQSQGVGTSLKHFAANNQETNRMTISAEVDERTLREIYLSAFETVVTRAQPWTIMCSYNKINGSYTSEDPWLLTTILRQEWGFDGVVVSDWGAVSDRVAGLAAGMDLEMPSSDGVNDARIVRAVNDGSLDEGVLDEAVIRLLRLANRYRVDQPDQVDSYNPDTHHALARTAAADAIVLLKNEDAALPIVGTGLTVGVIGEFARTPRYQGAGSSQVNPTRLDNALDALIERAQNHGSRVAFAPGYTLDEDESTTALIEDAVAVARSADVALLFVGLLACDESEGYDREHLDLPRAHLWLINAVAAVNPRTIVVLSNGSVVSLEPWHDAVPAILETWLLGQAGGGAVADVVFGAVNPSGRLAETIPLRLEDNPSYLNFPGEAGRVRYGEGVFVGYRYYESVGRPVRYPFGYGLSYTSFDHTNLVVMPNDDATVTVQVSVTNTGSAAGKDVVQVYVSPPARPVNSPARELRGFIKVFLEPGQSERVEITLSRRAFSYFDVPASQWVIARGEHSVQVARSARDVVLAASVVLDGDRVARELSIDSSVQEWFEHPLAGPALIQSLTATGGTPRPVDMDQMRMVASMPMRRLVRFPGTNLSEGQLAAMVHAAK